MTTDEFVHSYLLSDMTFNSSFSIFPLTARELSSKVYVLFH